ncbi:MAG: hypothetical protein V3T05_11200 [Myxococcota bacterium]
MESPRMTIVSLLSIAALLALTNACGLGLQDDLRNAIPGEEAVTINAPEGNSNALTSSDATTGEWSEFYLATRKITRGVNGGVVGMLRVIKWITEMPATSCDEGSCTWGPGSETLDPAEWRLVVVKDGENLYSYSLQGRPKETEDIDANYLDMVTGTSDTTSEVNHGIGTMQMHFDNWATLDPTHEETGLIDVAYDTTVEPQYLSVDFIGFSDGQNDDSSDAEAPTAASYYYSRHEDGAGNFQFVMLVDVHEGAVQPAVAETFAIRSRWNAQGEGRSDVEINGGDLQLNDGLDSVTAAECWDAGFKLTYADMTPLIVDPSHNVGSESNCPAELQTAQFPEI